MQSQKPQSKLKLKLEKRLAVSWAVLRIQVVLKKVLGHELLTERSLFLYNLSSVN